MFDMSFILKNDYFERHASDTCSRLGVVAMVTATSLTLTVCVAMAKRRYDPVYLKCGFSYIEDNKGQKPQCVICNEVLANESMKPSKLRRHLETKHPACKDKLVEFFQRQLQKLRTSQKCLTATCSKQEEALRASYHVAHRVAKAKKPHTIAEELI